MQDLDSFITQTRNEIPHDRESNLKTAVVTQTRAFEATDFE